MVPRQLDKGMNMTRYKSEAFLREWNGRDVRIRSASHAKNKSNAGRLNSESGTRGGIGIYGKIGHTWRLGTEFAHIRMPQEPQNGPQPAICDENPIRSRRFRFGNIGVPNDCTLCEWECDLGDHMAFAETILNTYL